MLLRARCTGSLFQLSRGHSGLHNCVVIIVDASLFANVGHFCIFWV